VKGPMDPFTDEEPGNNMSNSNCNNAGDRDGEGGVGEVEGGTEMRWVHRWVRPGWSLRVRRGKFGVACLAEWWREGATRFLQLGMEQGQG